ncbi:unnamed protein product, partial [Owenia fusiformis]
MKLLGMVGGEYEKLYSPISMKMSDPVYYISFDDTQGNLLQGININATLYNNPQAIDSKVGHGLSLDGNNQWVDLGTHENECFGDLNLCPMGYTLAMWIKFGAKNTEEMYYFSSGGQSGNSYGTTVFIQYGVLWAWVSTSTRTWETRFMNPPRHEWTHVLLTWRKDEGLQLFINGEEVMEDHTGTGRPGPPKPKHQVVLG